MNIGDVVRMSEEGRKKWPNATINPHRLEGMIESVKKETAHEFGIKVTWSNGATNSYAEEHLEVVKQEVSLDELYTQSGKRYIAGETYVEKSSRRKEGETHYIIQYNDSSTRSACVKKKDLLKLAAVLIELAEE